MLFAGDQTSTFLYTEAERKLNILRGEKCDQKHMNQSRDNLLLETIENLSTVVYSLNLFIDHLDEWFH